VQLHCRAACDPALRTKWWTHSAFPENEAQDDCQCDLSGLFDCGVVPRGSVSSPKAADSEVEGAGWRIAILISFAMLPCCLKVSRIAVMRPAQATRPPKR
jgi:hypothetical protein